MSERLPQQNPETKSDSQEILKRQQELAHQLHEKAARSEHEHRKKVQHIREKIQEAARSEKSVASDLENQGETEQNHPVTINKELKAHAYNRTLRRAQAQLPVAYRTFSKVIHAPAIEAASEAIGKTVARPSGILAGGVAAFLGSSAFLWVARHYGYEYNFLLFVFLFAGGFLLGLVTELLLRLVWRRRI